MSVLKRIFLMAALVALVAAPASADVIQPSFADLSSLAFSADNNGNIATTQVLAFPPSAISVTANSNDGGALDVEFITPLLSIANLAGDTFQVNYFNSNGSPWTWTLNLYETDGFTLIGSDSTSVGPNLTDTFSIGLNGNDVGFLEVVITGGPFFIPQIGAFDPSADSFLSIPEPASLMLFGVGFLATGASIRRRFAVRQ